MTALVDISDNHDMAEPLSLKRESERRVFDRKACLTFWNGVVMQGVQKTEELYYLTLDTVDSQKEKKAKKKPVNFKVSRSGLKSKTLALSNLDRAQDAGLDEGGSVLDALVLAKRAFGKLTHQTLETLLKQMRAEEYALNIIVVVWRQEKGKYDELLEKLKEAQDEYDKAKKRVDDAEKDASPYYIPPMWIYIALMYVLGCQSHTAQP